MIKDYFVFSFKNLKHRGVRSWLTLLGIFIGVTAVVALISLGNGLQLAVASQFGLSQTNLITIEAGGVTGYGPPGSGAVSPLTNKEFDAVKKVSSVKRAIKRYVQTGKLEYNDKVIFGYVVNIPDGKDRDFVYEQLDEGPVAGRFLKDSDSGKVFLGYNFYIDKTGLSKEVLPGKKILINGRDFEVVGILDKKGSFIFDNAIYMNEKDMENLFNITDEIDMIVAQPVSKDYMDRAKDEIEKALRNVRNVKIGEEDFSVSTPAATMATVNSVLAGVKIFIVLIAFISIFIGALGIINTMTTSVLERKKEIGIMKAIGAKNEQIFFQFFVESGLLGLVGGIAGTISGILIGIIGVNALNNFLGSDLGMVVDYSLIIYALVGSFFIGATAGIIPAMNAAKQNPVEALKR